METNQMTEFNMCEFDVIAAMCSNRGIGNNGKLPWPRIEKDLKYYKQMCSPKTKDKCTVIIKGRKTWDISSDAMKSNPGFVNIVVSKSNRERLKSNPYIYKVVETFDSAIECGSKLIQSGKCERIWILGGQKVYEDSVQHKCCRKIYLTEIYQAFNSDTFFPLIPSNFKDVSREEDGVDASIQEDAGIKFQFKVFQRIPKVSEMCDFYIMAAMCNNRGIGLDNKLPWPFLEKDYKHYMRLCAPNSKDKKSVRVYGRLTWFTVQDEEKSQQNVLNVVISKLHPPELDADPHVSLVTEDLDKALVYGKQLKDRGECDKLWVMGGQGLFETAIKHDCCKRVYLTQILKDYQCDTYFPAIPDNFKEISGEEDEFDSGIQEDNGVQYKFTVYERLSEST